MILLANMYTHFSTCMKLETLSDQLLQQSKLGTGNLSYDDNQYFLHSFIATC